MLDYTNDPKLLAKAFEIVANGDGWGHGWLEINGHAFQIDDPADLDLLKLVAQSAVRRTIEELQDALNEALGEPEKPEQTPEAELQAAADVFKKHVDSGYLLDVIVENERVLWLPRQHE